MTTQEHNGVRETQYEVRRSGNQIIISNGTKTKSINGRYGQAEELPVYAVEVIRKSGANPSDYFWFGGQPIRKTHREIVEKLAAEIRADYAQTPEGLREQRQRLLDRFNGCAEAAADTRTRNFHKYDTGRGMGRNEYDEKAEAAQAELRAFDQAHPEIRRTIEAEKAEAARRFVENN